MADSMKPLYPRYLCSIDYGEPSDCPSVPLKLAVLGNLGLVGDFQQIQTRFLKAP